MEIILTSSKRKPILIESDRIYKSNFQNCVNICNIKRYSRNKSLEAVFCRKIYYTIRGLLKKSVSENKGGNWIDVLPTITKQYENRVHTSTKLTPIQAPLKKNEGYVYHTLLDKSKKIKP